MPGVTAILLGTAQDGGVPQAGCSCARCREIALDPARAPLVACLGLAESGARQAWIVDATPDLPRQLRTLGDHAPECALAGVLLTHAHMGHYTGLAHLGREAWNTRGLPVFVSKRMASFLRTNAPWSKLVNLGNIELRVLRPGEPLALSAHLEVTPLAVPHRAEWTDTLAFAVRGPQRTLFYCPDVDSWDAWDLDLKEILAGADVALIDGTFFSGDELPGRSLREIPHPTVQDTVACLGKTRAAVRFIHLNHTNPLLGDGPERAWVEARGAAAGRTGETFAL